MAEKRGTTVIFSIIKIEKYKLNKKGLGYQLSEDHEDPKIADGIFLISKRILPAFKSPFNKAEMQVHLDGFCRLLRTSPKHISFHFPKSNHFKEIKESSFFPPKRYTPYHIFDMVGNCDKYVLRLFPK